MAFIPRGWSRLVLYSLDFAAVERSQSENRWDDAAAVLADAGRALARSGADFILICTNTMHKVADAVEDGSALPVLHICDATGAAIRRQGLRKVGLLGTRFVMEEPFYVDRLRDRFSIEVLVPNEDDRAVLHRIIYEELCRGVIEDSSRRASAGIIGRLSDRGAEGIVLGCTELPMLIKQDDVSVPLFDTTSLHAKAAVNRALAE